MLGEHFKEEGLLAGLPNNVPPLVSEVSMTPATPALGHRGWAPAPVSCVPRAPHL